MYFVRYEAKLGTVFEEKKNIFNLTKMMQDNFLDPFLPKSIFAGNFGGI
jgi:hypothetical protein